MAWEVIEGDAMEILPTLRAGSFDAVITDPPYIIGAVSSGTLASKSGTWTDMMNSAFWFQAWYEHCWRLLRENGSLWTFCNWRSLPVVMCAAAKAHLPVTSVLVWDKQWIGPGGHQGLRPAYELIVLCAKPEFVIPDRATRDIWQCLWSAHKPSGHPAEKPVALLSRILRTCALGEGATILDPFCGSGSTGVAARENHCDFVGIENDPEYAAMARGRIGAATVPIVPVAFDAPLLMTQANLQGAV